MIYAIFTTDRILGEYSEQIKEVAALLKENGVQTVLILEALFPESITREFVFNYVVEEHAFGAVHLDGAVTLQADCYLGHEIVICPKVYEGWKGRITFKINEIRKVFR